jgi:hypothetical protein
MKAIILLLMAMLHPAACETVFEKALGQSNRVIVVRREVPAVAPNSADHRALQAKAAGASYLPPDKAYEFKMLLEELPAKSQPKLLWKEIVPHYDLGPAIPSDVKFLDACFDGTNLVFFYKNGTLTYTRTTSRFEGTNSPLLSSAQRFLTDSPSVGRIVAKVEHISSDAGSPRVLVTFVNQEREIYALEGSHWEKRLQERTNPPASQR